MNTERAKPVAHNSRPKMMKVKEHESIVDKLETHIERQEEMLNRRDKKIVQLILGER